MNELSQDEVSTQHQLWPGIGLKIENAEFHRRAMEKAIEPPERTHLNVVMESAGAIIWNNWHQPFYAHLDAFLSAARSVPELIRCCFGVDNNIQSMRHWFDALDSGEKDRRTQFQDRFRSDYNAFRSLPLGNARHISEHRIGFAPVSVTVTGRFGLTYVGSPIRNIPNSETRDMPEGYEWMARPIPVHPMGSDFQIDGMPLFETCRAYLHEANSLVQRARVIADAVHGEKKLTSPPMEL